MHVKSALIAVAASSAAFYALGRYGGELPGPWRRPRPCSRPRPRRMPIRRTPRLRRSSPRPNWLKPRCARTAGVPGQAPKVDETALRYFASQGDTRRYEAELARLRALYPEWKPPTDLSTPAPTGDPELERMWRLFADGKFGEVRAAIAQRGSADPNWRAPTDLVAQLDRAEAGQRLVNASNARQWEQVIRIGTETPALLTCANVDALWRVAEAFVQTGSPERGRDAYAYVLTNCTNPAERVGTMQKALATLSEALVGPLLAQERQSEFSSIRDEIARRHVGKAADDSAFTATPEELSRIEALANAATTPDDPILLGFYFFRHGDAAKAATWFQTALARNGGAKAAEGAVLAFGAQQKYQDAEALGAQWLQAGPANRKAYLDVATALIAQEPAPRLEPAVIERIARTVGVDRYAPGGAGLGWYAYNSGQIAPAETWFETALAWDRGYEPAAYGLALVHQRRRDQAALRAMVAEWRSRSPRIAALLHPARGRDAARQTRPAPDAQAGDRLAPAPAERDSRRAVRAEPAPSPWRRRSRGSATAPPPAGAVADRGLRRRRERSGCSPARLVPAQPEAPGRCRRSIRCRAAQRRCAPRGRCRRGQGLCEDPAGADGGGRRRGCQCGVAAAAAQGVAGAAPLRAVLCPVRRQGLHCCADHLGRAGASCIGNHRSDADARLGLFQPRAL